MLLGFPWQAIKLAECKYGVNDIIHYDREKHNILRSFVIFIMKYVYRK